METQQKYPSSSHQCIITGEFVIIQSPGESWPRKTPSVRIYSAVEKSPSTDKGKSSEQAKLKVGDVKTDNDTKIRTFKIKLYVEQKFGIPGAFVIINNHKHKFFLASATLHAPDKQNIHFDCRSWVYPVKMTKKERRFFSNTSYLPSQTPEGLVELRWEELQSLRGNRSGERSECDRIYDYDFYNDLGNPDRGREHFRHVLGGTEHPYPRRGRTGRPSSKQNPSFESRPEPTSFDIYVPPDERLSLKKQSELILNIIKVTLHFVIPEEDSSSQLSSNFKSHEEICEMFSSSTKEEIEEIKEGRKRAMDRSSGYRRQEEKRINKIQEAEKWVMEKLKKISPNELVKKIKRKLKKKKKRHDVEKRAKKILKTIVPNEYVKEITRACKADRMKFLIPHIIAEVEGAWKDDDEFGRQMLAGINPTRIQSLEKTKRVWRSIDNVTDVTDPDLKILRGLSPKEAGEDRFFTLDHHDYLMPFLSKINTTGVCAYASRTLLIRTGDDTLKPVAIELSLPAGSPSSKVFLPPLENSTTDNKTKALWQLAKAHVAANDSVYHQLISHWLHTHAVVEPFIIASRRQLSVMHPIHRLLDPHFKDTMHINALARSIFINSGGILERILLSGPVSMELSSELYKKWRFDEQALPADLLKRGMAKEDSVQPAGVKLIFEDYPYGADGIKIWTAIQTWVTDFCNVFYKTPDSFEKDYEIQNWWSEIQNVGHCDQKNGWYKLTTVSDLIKALTTIVWIASGLHASVNFGQYAYAAYPPNRPTLCRKFIPEENQSEVNELLSNPDEYLLSMLPTRYEIALGVALMHVLSRHTPDEVYLGQRSSSNWTDNEEILYKFEKFHETLRKIEEEIMLSNRNTEFNNRWGPSKIPYKLLYPDTNNVGSTGGITGKGIPNSISI